MADRGHDNIGMIYRAYEVAGTVAAVEAAFPLSFDDENVTTVRASSFWEGPPLVVVFVGADEATIESAVLVFDGAAQASSRIADAQAEADARQAEAVVRQAAFEATL